MPADGEKSSVRQAGASGTSENLYLGAGIHASVTPSFAFKKDLSCSNTKATGGKVT